MMEKPRRERKSSERSVNRPEASFFKNRHRKKKDKQKEKIEKQALEVYRQNERGRGKGIKSSPQKECLRNHRNRPGGRKQCKIHTS